MLISLESLGCYAIQNVSLNGYIIQDPSLPENGHVVLSVKLCFLLKDVCPLDIFWRVAHSKMRHKGARGIIIS